MYKDNNNEVNDNDVNDNEFNDNEVNDNKVIENKVNDKKDKAKTLTSTRTNLRVQVCDFRAVLLFDKSFVRCFPLGHHWALAEDRAGLLGEEERMQRQHLLV